MTLENLLTNKYFTLALIVAVIALMAMYYQNSLLYEGMKNVDLLSTAQELIEKPWVDDLDNAYPYKKYDNSFDRYADKYVKAKLKKRGYKYNRNFLPRIDQTQAAYMKKDTEMIKPFYDQYDTKQAKELVSFPKPMDANPELSQCQPCKCNGSKKRRSYTVSESESDTEMSDF